MTFQTLIHCVWLSVIFAIQMSITQSERKLASSNCMCGVQVTNEAGLSPWTVFVYARSSNRPKTCTGAVIASNVIGVSLKCLLAPKTEETSPSSIVNTSQVTVTEFANGQGTSFPVLQILRKSSRSKFLGIVVDYNFADRNSSRKPVCVPEDCEFTSASILSLNASYESPTGETVPNLQVRKGDECDKGGKLGKGSRHLLCVTITGNSVKAEEGQFVFVDINKNPHGSESYVYLAGISTQVVQDGSKKHVFFTSVNSFTSAIDFITNTSSTEWCSEPWPWTKSPERLKRDESLDCTCGLLRPTPTGRVVGGVGATPYEFPWMILIYIFDPPDRLSICGASIISDRVLLTASHCVASHDLQSDPRSGYDVIGPKRKFFFFSNTHSKDFDDVRSLRIRSTYKTMVHPGYVDAVRRYSAFILAEFDIALFILDNPLDFTARSPDGFLLHRPVCLPKYNEKVDYIGKEILAAGWGKTHYDHDVNNSIAQTLQKIKLVAQPVETCLALHPEDYRKYHGKTTFCLSTDWMHAVDKGDSGGPIIVDNGKGKYYQIGAVSFAGPFANASDWQIGTTTHAADLQELMPFVDYYSNKYNAKYCKN